MAWQDRLGKTFDPTTQEAAVYRHWEESGAFQPDPDPSRTAFTIVIPPPNITGQLHMGHALDNTLQDLIIRFRRMQGYAALWVPGTDHASIATEARIVAALSDEGLDKATLGREAFLERAWAWKKQYAGRILEQLRSLGASCDWTRERFTMDEGLSRAVITVFCDMYRKGLIYRGERIVNWCPRCRTTISDAEVVFDEQNGHLWRIRYPAADGAGALELATTRPETMLGDTAVAVHPDDPRYQDWIGREVRLPLTDRVIPVIADTYVDPEFGTGVVKITPAHDPNDFEVGQRHNLPSLNVLDEDGRVNEQGGRYAGLDRYAARRRIVSELETQGLLVAVTAHQHHVGGCYRCTTTVEPRLSLQWFVRMQPLAGPAIEVVRDGHIRFVPERFEKIYFNWMENIRDWCISRQLWWGHRIPAWTCADCHRLTVAETEPDRCPECGGERLIQDPDTLDTWFSSALWPFSTLGWPEHTADLRRHFPTDVLVTGYDIIFFWVARMIFSSLAQTGLVPFRTVLMHGLVRDAEGRKMSKSLDNGIDPLEVIERYGADALRYALIHGSAPGNDQRFSFEKVEAGRNLINKIWNAARFVLMNLDDAADAASLDMNAISGSDLQLEDRWILSRLQTVVEEASANLERFELGLALAKTESFVRDEFCDWMIEISKSRLSADADPSGRRTVQTILVHVLGASLKLLHPFMPFASEVIFQALPRSEGDLITAAWPSMEGDRLDPAAVEAMDGLMQAIRAVRNIRSQMNVPPSRRVPAILVAADPAVRDRFWDGIAYLQRLAGIERIDARPDKRDVPLTAVTAIFPGGELYLPLAGLIDLDLEIDRLRQEEARLLKETERVRDKLADARFTGRAPERIVQAERDKLTRYHELLIKTRERLTVLTEAKAD